MRYQPAATLNNFIDGCEAISKISFTEMSFPVLLLHSNDVFLLNEAIEEFSKNIMKRNIIKASGCIPLINIKFDCNNDFTTEFQRLIKMLKLYSGFSNHYHGIVAMDISEWDAHVDSDEFAALMEYLSDTSKDRIYVFYTLKSENIFEHALSNYFVVKKKSVNLDKLSQVVNYTLTKLTDTGFETKDISSTLKVFLREISLSEQYQGAVTLNMISREIAHYVSEKKKACIDNTIIHDFTNQFKISKQQGEKIIGLIK